LHAEAEDPVDLLRRRGQKGARGAGGIPARSETEHSCGFYKDPRKAPHLRRLACVRKGENYGRNKDSCC